MSSQKNAGCEFCKGAQRGDLLEIEYTGKLEDGKVFDGSSIKVHHAALGCCWLLSDAGSAYILSLQYGTVHCSTVEYSTVKCGTVHLCIAVQLWSLYSAGCPLL